MIRSGVEKTWLVLLALVALQFPAWGVGTTGTIVGTLTDSSGAVIPNATVIVAHQGTGTERQAESNGRGEFAVPLLLPGTYQVTIVKEGFRKLVLVDLTLSVDQTLRVDAVVPIGDITTEVQINSRSSSLQTDNSNLGEVVDRQKITGLPLNQRNFLAFALLVPGASTPAYGSANLTQGGGAINVNGAREQSNTFLLDGIGNTDPRLNQYAVLPSIEAIEEFKVQSGNSTAAFGRTAGANVNVVLKSGSNAWHGSVFEFLRNRHLDAKNFFDLPDCENSSIPGTCGEIPRLDRNQFGGSFGGPIVRNRTFFFTAYEGLRLRQGTAHTATVPSRFQRQRALEAVPREDRNASGEAVLNLYPFANVGGDLVTSNTFVGSPLIHDTLDQTLVKIDHQASSRDSLSGHYAIFDQDRFNPYDFTGFVSNLPGFGTFSPKRGQSARFTWLHVSRDRIVNEAHFGFNRSRTAAIQENTGENQNQLLGFPQIASDSLFWGYPQVDLAGFDSIGEARLTPQEIQTNTFQVVDNLAWNPSFHGGRHQLKLGANILKISQKRVAPLLARGSWNFAGNRSGNSLQDLLRGTPTFALAGRGDTTLDLRQPVLGFHLHDDLRVSPGLTLNFGLRYEYHSPPINHLRPFSVPDLGPDSAVCLPRPDCQFLPAGTAGIPLGTFDKDFNNFAPRFGFAWRPRATGRLVVRSAYGIFYDAGVLGTPNQYSLNPPAFALQSYPNRGADTIQSIVAQTGLSSAAFAFKMDPKQRDAYIQQWHLGLQYEMFAKLLVDLAYVGTKGTKLSGGRDLNQAVAGGGSRPYPQFGPIATIEPRASSSYHAFQTRVERELSPGQTLLAAYTWSRSIDDASSFLGVADSESLFPQDSNNLRGERSLSTFHASHRFVLSYLQQLTFGKGQRWRNHSAARSLLGDWEVGVILALQSGHPFTVLRSIDQSGTGPGPAGDLRDRPDLIRDPYQPGPVPNHPDPACHATVSRGGRAADVVYDPASWFNPCAFAAPGTKRFGSEGRNSLIGPGLANMDFSLSKIFPLRHEGHHLQIRFEFFNLFNHPTFDLPEIFFDSNRFASVKSSNAFETSPPRQVQLGVKYVF